MPIVLDLLCGLSTYKKVNGAGHGKRTANGGGGSGTRSRGCGSVGEHLLIVPMSSMTTRQGVLHAREAIPPECRLAVSACN